MSLTSRQTLLLASLGSALLVPACRKDEPVVVPPRDGPLGAQRCNSRPGPNNHVNPVLQRPFDGNWPVLTLFDHDLPLRNLHPLTASDSELTYCGLVALGLTDGSGGYSFALPAKTPVLAAAKGEVLSAGPLPAFVCPVTMRKVDDQLAVEVRHDGLGGAGFITRYVNFGTILVKPGDQVVAGQRLGLSGLSPCTSTPMLAFEVEKLTGTKTGAPVLVDPFGWDGPALDPWAENEKGSGSEYLWIDGEAPSLKAAAR